MKKTIATFAVSWICAFAQRPSNPALLIPQAAPELDYVASANPVTLPAGTTMGAPASVAFDAKGHLIVLNRGPQALMEFDMDGKFLRAFGEGLFTRTHGLRIDPTGNIWVTTAVNTLPRCLPRSLRRRFLRPRPHRARSSMGLRSMASAIPGLRAIPARRSIS
jgi:hypothetical protein